LREGLAAYDAALGPHAHTALGTLNDLVRWQILSGKVESDCATARRAADLFGLKPEDASLEANYERAVLQGCLAMATKAADNRSAYAAAAEAVHRLAKEGDPRLRNLDALTARLAQPSSSR
jgi:hypothetical protein